MRDTRDQVVKARPSTHLHPLRGGGLSEGEGEGKIRYTYVARVIITINGLLLLQSII